MQKFESLACHGNKFLICVKMLTLGRNSWLFYYFQKFCAFVRILHLRKEKENRIIWSSNVFLCMHVCVRYEKVQSCTTVNPGNLNFACLLTMHNFKLAVVVQLLFCSLFGLITWDAMCYSDNACYEMHTFVMVFIQEHSTLWNNTYCTDDIEAIACKPYSSVLLYVGCCLF